MRSQHGAQPVTRCCLGVAVDSWAKASGPRRVHGPRVHSVPRAEFELDDFIYDELLATVAGWRITIRRLRDQESAEREPPDSHSG
ncbi:MAG: hypothetical protein M3O70_11720 [Actinomycetota bacterium]|nr:hypothetical protein [Actinomycetota bacterium]